MTPKPDWCILTTGMAYRHARFYYEGVKEYVDATDNFNSYIFSFLYNKYGISDVLILEEKKEKTVVTDFHIYETKLK